MIYFALILCSSLLLTSVNPVTAAEEGLSQMANTLMSNVMQDMFKGVPMPDSMLNHLSVAMDKKEGVMYSTMGSMLNGVRDVKQGGEISAAVEKFVSQLFAELGKTELGRKVFQFVEKDVLAQTIGKCSKKMESMVRQKFFKKKE